MLTVRSYHYGDDKKNVDIEVPAIDVELGGSDWAESVNRLIEATVEPGGRAVRGPGGGVL